MAESGDNDRPLNAVLHSFLLFGRYWPDTDEEVKFGDFVITSTYKR